jgi:kynurenine formamidase
MTVKTEVIAMQTSVPGLSRLRLSSWMIAFALCFSTAVGGDEPRFIDHSLLVAPEYPVTWPSAPFPDFQITHQRTIGPDSANNIDSLLIDGNTGTQLDVPPHSVTRPDLKRPKSGPLGLAYIDKIEAWQFVGEAYVIDVRDLLDQAPKGSSPLVRREHVEHFEMRHRKLQFGDVVLFRSDCSDRYYRPFPAGSRYIADILDRKWTAVSRARRVIGEPVISDDLYPPCLSAAGIELNPNQHMNGVNLKPLLSETDELPRASLFWVLAFAPLQ